MNKLIVLFLLYSTGAFAEQAVDVYSLKANQKAIAKTTGKSIILDSRNLHIVLIGEDDGLISYKIYENGRLSRETYQSYQGSGITKNLIKSFQANIVQHKPAAQAVNIDYTFSLIDETSDEKKEFLTAGKTFSQGHYTTRSQRNLLVKNSNFVLAKGVGADTRPLIHFISVQDAKDIISNRGDFCFEQLEKSVEQLTQNPRFQSIIQKINMISKAAQSTGVVYQRNGSVLGHKITIADISLDLNFNYNDMKPIYQSVKEDYFFKDRRPPIVFQLRLKNPDKLLSAPLYTEYKKFDNDLECLIVNQEDTFSELSKFTDPDYIYYGLLKEEKARVVEKLLQWDRLNLGQVPSRPFIEVNETDKDKDKPQQKRKASPPPRNGVGRSI